MCVYRLYRERLSQVNSKLAEVEAGRAAEYLEPLAVLLENMQVRTKVAGKWNRQWPASHRTHWPFQLPPRCVFLSLSGIYRELCLESVKHKYDCETQAACQHWEVGNTRAFITIASYAGGKGALVTYPVVLHVQSEKLLLFDTVQNELEEKIRRLEEDRHSIDITSGNRGHRVIFVTSAQHIVAAVIKYRSLLTILPVRLSELWTDDVSGRKKRRDALSPDKKRRRPSVVSDILPLLIMLRCFYLCSSIRVLLPPCFQ